MTLSTQEVKEHIKDLSKNKIKFCLLSSMIILNEYKKDKITSEDKSFMLDLLPDLFESSIKNQKKFLEIYLPLSKEENIDSLINDYEDWKKNKYKKEDIEYEKHTKGLLETTAKQLTELLPQHNFAIIANQIEQNGSTKRSVIACNIKNPTTATDLFEDGLLQYISTQRDYLDDDYLHRSMTYITRKILGHRNLMTLFIDKREKALCVLTPLDVDDRIKILEGALRHAKEEKNNSEH